MKKNLNDYLKPRPVDLKSGWKNNSKIVREIVDVVAENHYIDDEECFMETVDAILEVLRDKFNKDMVEE